jgi:hypothetical protein
MVPHAFKWRVFGLSTAHNITHTIRTFHKRACHKSQITTSRQAIRQHFPDRPLEYMPNYLELENLNHSSGTFDIHESMKESKQLAAILTPTYTDRKGRRITHAKHRGPFLYRWHSIWLARGQMDSRQVRCGYALHRRGRYLGPKPSWRVLCRPHNRKDKIRLLPQVKVHIGHS